MSASKTTKPQLQSTIFDMTWLIMETPARLDPLLCACEELEEVESKLQSALESVPDVYVWRVCEEVRKLRAQQQKGKANGG